MPKHACGHVRPNQTVWQLIISRVNLSASCSRAFAKARCKSEKVPRRMFWTAQHFQQKGKVDSEGGREGSERATACRDLCGVCATAHLSSLSFFFFSFCFSGHRLAGSGHARIHLLEGMCDGISAWNLGNEFTRSRNLSQIFLENTRHCPGDAGFNLSQGGMHIHTHMEIYFRM